jgi:hypothetical protein
MFPPTYENRRRRFTGYFDSNEARRALASSMYAVCKSCGDNGIAIRENTVVSRFFRTLKRGLRLGPRRIKVLDAAS